MAIRGSRRTASVVKGSGEPPKNGTSSYDYVLSEGSLSRRMYHSTSRLCVCTMRSATRRFLILEYQGLSQFESEDDEAVTSSVARARSEGDAEVGSITHNLGRSSSQQGRLGEVRSSGTDRPSRSASRRAERWNPVSQEITSPDGVLPIARINFQPLLRPQKAEGTEIHKPPCRAIGM